MSSSGLHTHAQLLTYMCQHTWIHINTRTAQTYTDKEEITSAIANTQGDPSIYFAERSKLELQKVRCSLTVQEQIL